MLVMGDVNNRIRMIQLIEKIERNRKFANEMHVKDVSVLNPFDRKYVENLKGESYEKQFISK